jgi:hypothetical protein
MSALRASCASPSRARAPRPSPHIRRLRAQLQRIDRGEEDPATLNAWATLQRLCFPEEYCTPALPALPCCLLEQEARVQILAERFARGAHIWHPLDLGLRMFSSAWRRSRERALQADAVADRLAVRAIGGGGAASCRQGGTAREQLLRE